MKEDMILIDYDPFVMESRAHIVENGKQSIIGVSSNLNELSGQIIGYCQQYNQYNVKFHAPIGTYYELKRQLEKMEKDTYGVTKINLGVC